MLLVYRTTPLHNGFSPAELLIDVLNYLLRGLPLPIKFFTLNVDIMLLMFQ